MFKKLLFAVAPLMLVAGTVVAHDNSLSTVAKLAADTSDSAQTDVIDELGQTDVDALLGEGEEEPEEAIAAGFRRFGHRYGRSYGHGYGHSYGYRHGYGYGNGYGHGYGNGYGGHGFGHSYYYQPVHYSYYTPVYSSYWGCW